VRCSVLHFVPSTTSRLALVHLDVGGCECDGVRVCMRAGSLKLSLPWSLAVCCSLLASVEIYLLCVAMCLSVFYNSR